MQPCQIYYNLYNILYGCEKHTISIKVGKIYYINGKIDLYYIKPYLTLDILYKTKFNPGYIIYMENGWRVVPFLWKIAGG